MSRADKRAMVAPSHQHLSVVEQCGLLGLSRSSFYDQPVHDPATDLALMAVIDRQFLETPYDGSRKMVAVLRRAGHVVNRKRVRRLMRRNCFRNGPLGVKPPNASRRRFHASVRGQHAAATPCDQKEPASRSHKA
jgi:hypothetical protein